MEKRESDHLFALCSPWATLQPEAIAIMEREGSSLSYRQLFDLAGKWSAILSSHLVSNTPEPIGVYGTKDRFSVAAILSVLASNCAYVPLDADAPDSRISTVLSEGEIRLLFAQKKLIKNHFQFSEVISLTEDWSLFKCPDKSPTQKLPKNSAYILFTSGSTGVPKGVVVSHSAACAFVQWGKNTFRTSGSDVYSSIAPFHFDLSVFDIFVSLSSGGKLILLSSEQIRQPETLSRAISEEKITVWYSTPTTLKLMVDFGKTDDYDFSSLRHCLFAGEVFPVPALRRLQEVLPGAFLANLYGPTETNVCTWFALPKGKWDSDRPIPIGVLTEQYEGLIDGEIPCEEKSGELMISGASLMSGYFGDNEKTVLTFSEIGGRKWYHTGDLVEFRGGFFHFKGRKDRMIKRRGYRIEMAEIELALNQISGIEGSACLAISLREDETGIAAFICGSATKDTLNIRRELLLRIPIYMMPDKFITLETLPQTSSQKIDYSALQAYYAKNHS